jgi:hypothetical protein
LPVAAGTPFDVYVQANFRTAYTNAESIVHLRNDIADEILDGAPGDPLTPTTVGASRWSTGPGTATLDADEPLSLTDVLELSRDRCTRIAGTFQATPSAGGTFLSFRFDRPEGGGSNVRLNVVGDQIVSGSDVAVFDMTSLRADTVDDGQPDALPATDPGPHDFALVIGDRSAALVIDGRIRAAVRLDQQSRVALEVRQGGVVLDDLTARDLHGFGGC